MRLYIGTLYTIENEYEECLRSIRAQTYGDFDHFVFKDLPNKQAHTALFQSFLERADEYDALVKVDADMVLARDTLFENIVRKLEENDWVDVLSIAVHDFFSDGLIWSLNAYRNTVRWELGNESLFVDRPRVQPERYLMDDSELVPAAYHCKDPSPYQAFHFGVHRGLKVIQPGRINKNEDTSKSQWNFLERTWVNFQRTGDVRLGLACLGAELAYARRFRTDDLDYSNPRLLQVLEKYLQYGSARLRFEVRKHRLLNWGILPGWRRRKLLCYLSGSWTFERLGAA